MDELLTIGFETELGDDAEYHGHFTIVFSPDDGGPTPDLPPRSTRVFRRVLGSTSGASVPMCDRIGPCVGQCPGR
jgi:hypothetical protein